MEKAIINIKGLQDLDNMDLNELELETDGQFEYNGGVSTFVYQESELTGLEGTETTFVIDDEKVSMTRRGSVNAQMVFQKGHKHYFVYETIFGAMTMGMETHSITKRFGADGGELEVHYVVDFDNSVKNKNVIKINVRMAQ